MIDEREDRPGLRFSRRTEDRSGDPFPKYGGKQRIVLLVLMLIAVLYLMYEAGKPENWEWMQFPEPPVPSEPAPDEPAPDEPAPDEPAPDPPAPIEELPDGPVPDQPDPESAPDVSESTIQVPIRDEPRLPSGNGEPADDPSVAFDAPGELQDDPVPSLEWSAVHLDSATREEFWRQVFRRLGREPRLQLYQFVEAVARGDELDEVSSRSMRELFPMVERMRQAFHSRLVESMIASDDRPGDQQSWSERLLEMQQAWEFEIQPAVRTALDGRPLSERQQQLYAWWADTLKQIAIEQVRDGTNSIRDVELPAWYEFTRYLLRSSAEEIRQASQGQVAVHQLLGQSSFFRGQVVTVQGRLLRGQRIRLAQPIAGQPAIYELWIAPDQPSVFPYCVYALEWPVDEPLIEEQVVSLNLPVTVHGIFFKRRFYYADDESVAEAPLLLARRPEIQPVARPHGEVAGGAFPWDATTITLAGLSCVALAMLIAWAVYRSSQSKARRARVPQERLGQALDELQHDPAVETVEQRLEKLHDARDG